MNRTTVRLNSTENNSERGKQLTYSLELYTLVKAEIEKDSSCTIPTLTFSDRLSLDLGDITLNLIYYGKAHTNSDIVIYIQEEKILMNGDLFVFEGRDDFRELRNQNVRKADVNRWYETLNVLLGTNYDIERIVTGHGYVLTKNDLTEFYVRIKTIWETFNAGKEFSAKVKLEKVLTILGLEAMLTEYRNIRSNPTAKYYFFESEFNNWGYALLNDGKINESIEVFRIAVDMYPESGNTYDSLGDAYMRAGNIDIAIENYEKSLKLNPDNNNAKEMLKQLKDDK